MSDWEETKAWFQDHPVVLAFLIALVIVIVITVAFFIHWLAGTIILCGGFAVFVLTLVILYIIEV